MRETNNAGLFSGPTKHRLKYCVVLSARNGSSPDTTTFVDSLVFMLALLWEFTGISFCRPHA